MPEGPEIRRAADRIAKVLVGQQLEDVYFGQAHLKQAKTQLIGATVVRVVPKGKAIVTECSNGLTLYSHNQLYGVWRIAKRGELPKTNRTLRVGLHTPSHSALLYSASNIALLDPPGVAAHPYLKKLGPDALDLNIEWRDIVAQLMQVRFRGRSLAALYLDQAFVAGIGNYLRSEILHVAGRHPQQRPMDLSRGELGLLARTTLELTRRAYATAGITNAPQRVSRLRKAGASRARLRFAVFDRAGENCYTCGDVIQRIEVGSRRFYLCSRCQPKGAL